LEESTLSSKVLGVGRKYAFFKGFGEWKKVRFLRKFWGLGFWKKVRFLRKFWGMEESTLSSKVLGNGRKYAFFESFGEWKKVRFLLEYFGFGGFGRKYAFF
jgi:hypothetical protein